MGASKEIGAKVFGTIAASVLLVHCGSRSQLESAYETVEVAASGGASAGSETLNRAGRVGSGGTWANGGARATGGSPVSGGARATGGGGGFRMTGGTPATGGARAAGGGSATGGVRAAGGRSAAGGVRPVGGASFGGKSGSGSSSSGGTSPRCAPDGQYHCLGTAQRGRELCIGGVYQARPCQEDRYCESATGSCLLINSKCKGRLPGYSYCSGSDLTVCGPDQVSSSLLSTTCLLGCVETAAGAACAKDPCGDGIRQPQEQCDDGNTRDGDACPANCRIPVVSIAGGAEHVCALAENGVLKCWGDNSGCQLGIGATGNRGNQPAQMGDALPALKLGPRAVPKSVIGGARFTCAVLTSGRVKCWGSNKAGTLGIGTSQRLGCAAQDMGAALDATQLGTGVSVTALIAGDLHACALTSDGRVKCWGSNFDGVVGLGDFQSAGVWGATAERSGNALPFVPLSSAALTVKALGGGAAHSCAIFADNRLKCWGSNAQGALGIGRSDLPPSWAFGDDAGEMGDALPFISLPQGRKPVTVLGGSDDEMCALLDDGTVVCWGRGVGDAPFEMGDHLVPVPLGTGRRAKFLAKGRNHQCVILENNHVKCWGRSTVALGLEDDRERTAVADLGNSLPEVALGKGRTALSLALGDLSSCALLDDHTVKCWGDNSNGVLGVGYPGVIGNEPGEMGDALPTVDLAF